MEVAETKAWVAEAVQKPEPKSPPETTRGDALLRQLGPPQSADHLALPVGAAPVIGSGAARSVQHATPSAPPLPDWLATPGSVASGAGGGIPRSAARAPDNNTASPFF